MSSISLKMNGHILTAAVSAAGVGIPGALAGPHADVPALIAIWTALFLTLANDAGAAMSKDQAMKLATGVALAVGSFAGGVKLATTVAAWTGAATLPAVVANLSLNGVITWLVGRGAAHVFQEHETDQTVENMIRAIVGALGITPKPST